MASSDRGGVAYPETTNGLMHHVKIHLKRIALHVKSEDREAKDVAWLALCQRSI